MELIICILILILVFLLYKNVKSKTEFSKEKTAYLAQIEELRKQIVIKTQQLNSSEVQISENTQAIAKLKKELDESVRELNFYKNIEVDSGNLNAPVDSKERQHLLEQAAKQVTEVRLGNQVSGLSPITSSTHDRILLDDEQLFACEELERGSGNFFITGKAGTGKSFLLDVFRKTTTKSHIVLAPTGIAALNVKGATIHSTFGYYNLVKLDVDMICESNIKLKSEKWRLLKNVSTIIIDEISMVRSDIFEKIDRILRIINRNDLPFGGKQMILFGDLFQLPPVTKSKEYYYLLDRFGGTFFFCSDAYKTGDFRFLELTINHRQKEDGEYFSLLNRVRDGSATPKDIETLNSRVIKDESVFDRFTTLLPTKAEVEKINQHHLEQLNTPGFTYPAKIQSNENPNRNDSLEHIFPILSSLYLKKGALVMMVANDPEHRWVNGTLGIISNLSNDSISVAINNRTYDIHPCDFTEQEITYIDGKITYKDILTATQYPLVPAYAITIHKSQGQTYQNIVCDIDRCFANGQAYVALSRCASLEGLHLKNHITGTSIHVDKSVLDFYHKQTHTHPGHSKTKKHHL